MKLGIILQSNNPEHVWNALRLGITALKAKHSVQIFLFNEGVEIGDIPDTEHYDISKKLDEFKSEQGTVLRHGTCVRDVSKEQIQIRRRVLPRFHDGRPTAYGRGVGQGACD